MKKPWNIEEYEEKDYLHNRRLKRKQFVRPPDSRNDHEHCELCWNKISIYEGDLHFGYYEEESKSWICPTCYNDFKDLFGWLLIDDSFV